MKKVLGIIIVVGLLNSCGKVEEYSNDFSSAAFINASPFSNPPPATPTINMRVFVDDLQKTGSNVVYTGASGYLGIAPGTRRIDIRSSLDLITKFAESTAENFVANTASTFVVYDTINATTGRAKLLRLSDTLTVPATGFVKVRFLPLAINAPAMDVTMLRTSVTPNDSVTFFNQAYIGAAPSPAAIAALSAFRQIPLGAYTLKMKVAGTQSLLGTQALSVANLAGTAGITGINTIFATGTAKGQPLRIGLFRNYP